MFTVCSGVGSIGESTCSFTIRERQRRSLRRRRSGGPELFASVMRRGNNCLSAQLPPLPPVTCSHAKLEVSQRLCCYTSITNYLSILFLILFVI
jgi:hypothetical protein